MMNAPNLFGLFAAAAMLVTYALENQSHWFALAASEGAGRSKREEIIAWR